MKKISILLTITLLAMASFISCQKDDEGGGNIKKGKLSGSSWVYKSSYTDSSGGGTEDTFTFKFTSNKEGTVTQTGWYRTYDYTKKKLGPKQNVNRSQNFTYTYSPEIREGIMTFSTQGIFSKGNQTFSISDDFTEMKKGNTKYKRQ